MGILQNRGGTLYDLGSGTGKACVAAAILHNFDQCVGVECLEGLFSVSLELLASYNTRGVCVCVCVCVCVFGAAC